MTQETKVINGTGGGTFLTSWAYDVADRVKSMTYPGGNGGQAGETVNYTYDAAGRLYSVIGTNTYVHSTTYNALGQPLTRFIGSSAPVVKQSYSYDDHNFRLTGLASGVSPDYNNLQNISYTYDSKGNVLSIADATIPDGSGGVQTQSFTYDALDRLATAQATGAPGIGGYAQVSYEYNAAGNITNFQGTSFAYNDAAHKHAVTHVGGTQKYWYDAAGNATRRITAGQDITLSYDHENRLTGISGGATATYIYDGDGKLVKKTIAGTTTTLIGNYYELAGGTAKKHYYAGDNELSVAA